MDKDMENNTPTEDQTFQTHHRLDPTSNPRHEL